MNVEIGAEAAQFPEKEYINGIAVAVYCWLIFRRLMMTFPMASSFNFFMILHNINYS
jgi:hypothetical protein